jgi:23S rRNA (adenine-N6)-dimethyltransferase
VGAQRRAPRPSGSRADGQHLLRSAVLASELVQQADIGRSDLVVEIGAGSGALTRPLARHARRVIAVERDPIFVDHLRPAFASRSNVQIICANALHVPLPQEPFRVFGNLPFSFGTRILRRLLDDASSPLVRVDALVQLEMARKRAAIAPSTLVSLGWLPWWEFTIVRRVPRSAFRPVPSVDAAMLTIRRREPALLAPSGRAAFVRLLARAFASPDRPVNRLLQADRQRWSRLAEERGLIRDARPAELDVFDWIAVFELVGTRREGRAR